MVALILFIVFGLGFSYFATQNTLLTSINLGGFIIPDIPLYLIVIISVAFGLLTGGLFSVIKTILHMGKLNKEHNELSKTKQESLNLTKRIHQLEVENAKLKTKLGESDQDEDSL